MNNSVLAAVLVLSFNSASHSQSTPLTEYSATYEASANGLAATGTRSLTKTGANSYELSNSLVASLVGQTLAQMKQLSAFELVDDQIQPQNYSYTLSGVSHASHAIAFNWDAALAISSEDDESWQIPLQSSVMDELSYQTAIRQALIGATGIESNLTFEIIDGDEIETHEYRRAGNEVLSTPIGELTTVKLERVRDASDERVTEIWLATDWNFLLVRMEQLSNSGLRIELELKSAVLGGVKIEAND
jgi:hypothetical protein